MIGEIEQHTKEEFEVQRRTKTHKDQWWWMSVYETLSEIHADEALAKYRAESSDEFRLLVRTQLTITCTNERIMND